MADDAGWRSFTAGIVTEAMRRIRRGGMLGAGLFTVAGVALHRAWLGDGHAPVVQALALGLVPLFALLGLAAGAGLAVTATLRRLLPELERRLHELVQPAMSRLLASTRLGEASLSVEALPRVLDAETSRLTPVEPAGPRPGPGHRLAHLAWHWVLALLRRGLVRELAAYLEREGQSHFTPAVVERFVRERLVGLVIRAIRWRVDVVHAALWAASAVLVAGPLVWLLARWAA